LLGGSINISREENPTDYVSLATAFASGFQRATLFVICIRDNMAISYPLQPQIKPWEITLLKATATLVCVGFVGVWLAQVWKVVGGV
jgi:hypothetical protein